MEHGNYGNYTRQPRSLQMASVFQGIATNGGNHALYKAAPTREKACQAKLALSLCGATE